MGAYSIVAKWLKGDMAYSSLIEREKRKKERNSIPDDMGEFRLQVESEGQKKKSIWSPWGL